MEAAEAAFGSELEDHDWERERKILPLVAGARRVRRRAGGRVRSRIRVRPLDPGRRAAVRRRHLGRRPADAPPPRDPARLHAQAARRRAELGRADRSALGVGGVDLRPLRLRPGGAGCRREVESATVRAQGRAGVERERQAHRLRRGVPALPGGLRPRPRRQGGDALALGDMVEGAQARRSEGVAPRREPEVLRRRRGRREGRGLHDLPRQGRVGGRLPEGRGPRGRGSSRPRRRWNASSGASCTRST